MCDTNFHDFDKSLIWTFHDFGLFLIPYCKWLFALPERKVDKSWFSITQSHEKTSKVLWERKYENVLTCATFSVPLYSRFHSAISPKQCRAIVACVKATKGIEFPKVKFSTAILFFLTLDFIFFFYLIDFTSIFFFFFLNTICNFWNFSNIFYLVFKNVCTIILFRHLQQCDT